MQGTHIFLEHSPVPQTPHTYSGDVLPKGRQPGTTTKYDVNSLSLHYSVRMGPWVNFYQHTDCTFLFLLHRYMYRPC